jgi:hypothetical protein
MWIFYWFPVVFLLGAALESMTLAEFTRRMIDAGLLANLIVFALPMWGTAKLGFLLWRRAREAAQLVAVQVP